MSSSVIALRRMAALAVLALVACAQPADRDTPRAPDVIYLPTPPEAVEGIMEMTAVGQGDVVYDLGSGDGRLVIAAAQRGATATGVEIDPKLIETSQANAYAAGVTDRTRFIQADLFQFDFSDATVVTLYLSERLNIQLRPRLLAELEPGTRVASYIFGMGDWSPDRTARFADNRVSMWVVPADAAGTWRWQDEAAQDGRTYRLTLTQSYQSIEGTLAVGDTGVGIRDARLEGALLNFAVPASSGIADQPLRFEGRVEGNTIHGTVQGSGPARSWSANRVSRPE